ncbi:MAG: hypothetical protein IKK03_08820 [Lachnospiraceae bacterium]|nr:hypothetical protein [Lachnospiraceae bacterium]
MNNNKNIERYIYLAIDLGTTGCRSILFDNKLQQLAVAYEEYGLITPREKWTEQDAEDWWNLTLRTAKAAIEKAGISGRDIRGISISSQGITIVPVDRNLKPLCNAISWLDVRAEAQTRQIEQDFGQEMVYALTGKPIDAAYSLPKIMWLKQERPQIYKDAWKILMPLDYLTAKFTGRCVTDYSMASGTLMYDIQNQCWSRDVLEHYQIKETLLPEVLSSGEPAGYVLPEVAKLLGLREDCMVAVGAQDQKCAAYGAGLEEGVMTISLGTAAAVTKCWTKPDTAVNRGVGWGGYVDVHTWVTEGVINTAGTCLRWTRDMLFKGEAYEVMNEEAKEAMERGSSLLFYPYLNGPSSPDFYPDSEGTFYGVNLATKRGDFALAVMEGIAFQIRILLETMEAYGNVHTLILFGGGANSRIWCQIIADVTGMELRVPKTPEAAGAGAARLAAKAAGQEIEPLSCDASYQPSERAYTYQEKYKKYRDIEKKLWKQEGLA